jgi:predicted DNA-binding protein
MYYNKYYKDLIMTTIRLSNDIENILKNIAKNEHKSKSEIIKLALLKYFENYNDNLSPYTLGKDFFGKYGSGKKDNSQNYKNKLKEKIGAKLSH